MSQEGKKYWFNTYFAANKKVFTDPYSAVEGKQEPKYATINGPYDTHKDAADARREQIKDTVEQQ